jgi:DtxR family Mn-dependent transcriptional regulator
MKKTTSALENYLKAIYVLQKKDGYARVRDLARMLKVKGPSAVKALQRLEHEGLSVHERYGKIELTPEGEEIAKNMIDRHNNIKSLLNRVLGVAEHIADKDACEIEHAISPQTFSGIVRFMEYVNKKNSADILLFKEFLAREKAAADVKKGLTRDHQKGTANVDF